MSVWKIIFTMQGISFVIAGVAHMGIGMFEEGSNLPFLYPMLLLTAGFYWLDRGRA